MSAKESSNKDSLKSLDPNEIGKKYDPNPFKINPNFLGKFTVKIKTIDEAIIHVLPNMIECEYFDALLVTKKSCEIDVIINYDSMIYVLKLLKNDGLKKPIDIDNLFDAYKLMHEWNINNKIITSTEKLLADMYGADKYFTDKIRLTYNSLWCNIAKKLSFDNLVNYICKNYNDEKNIDEYLRSLLWEMACDKTQISVNLFCLWNKQFYNILDKLCLRIITASEPIHIQLKLDDICKYTKYNVYLSCPKLVELCVIKNNKLNQYTQILFNNIVESSDLKNNSVEKNNKSSEKSDKKNEYYFAIVGNMNSTKGIEIEYETLCSICKTNKIVSLFLLGKYRNNNDTRVICRDDNDKTTQKNTKSDDVISKTFVSVFIDNYVFDLESILDPIFLGKEEKRCKLFAKLFIDPNRPTFLEIITKVVEKKDNLMLNSFVDEFKKYVWNSSDIKSDDAKSCLSYLYSDSTSLRSRYTDMLILVISFYKILNIKTIDESLIKYLKHYYVQKGRLKILAIWFSSNEILNYILENEDIGLYDVSIDGTYNLKNEGTYNKSTHVVNHFLSGKVVDNDSSDDDNGREGRK